MHLTSDLDLTPEALRAVLDLAHEVKRTPARFSKTLAGQYVTLLFEKPSLRTRLTFELATKQLGGDAVASEIRPGREVKYNFPFSTPWLMASRPASI